MISWLDTLEPLAAAPLPRFAERAPQADAPMPDAADLYAEAEAVLSSAHAEAAELIEDARVQAEALREAAWQEGVHSGTLEARAAVEAELRANWAARQDALRSELDAIALDIARQVIKTEVSQNPAVVQAVLANALRRITDKDNVRVRVSVSDAPRVKEAREDLMEIVDGLRFIEITEDRRVGDGGCVIETNAGTIDAKIETQLAEVARALGQDKLGVSGNE